MSGWVALLRAVNVGGTGKLPMAELKVLGEALGLEQVRTYIASGNLIFASDRTEPELRAAIEGALEQQFGKRIGVLVRSAAELAGLVADNPWPDRPGNRVVALFTDGGVSLEGVRNQRQEKLQAGPRAIYIDYGNGMADSTLVIPAAMTGTVRNMNTVRQLADLAQSVGETR
ncbi:MAG: DUF1697 domain-containing protein [Novosphingobium sp.]